MKKILIIRLYFIITFLIFFSSFAAYSLSPKSINSEKTATLLKIFYSVPEIITDAYPALYDEINDTLNEEGLVPIELIFPNTFEYSQYDQHGKMPLRFSLHILVQNSLGEKRDIKFYAVTRYPNFFHERALPDIYLQNSSSNIKLFPVIYKTGKCKKRKLSETQLLQNNSLMNKIITFKNFYKKTLKGEILTQRKPFIAGVFTYPLYFLSYLLQNQEPVLKYDIMEYLEINKKYKMKKDRPTNDDFFDFNFFIENFPKIVSAIDEAYHKLQIVLWDLKVEQFVITESNEWKYVDVEYLPEHLFPDKNVGNWYLTKNFLDKFIVIWSKSVNHYPVEISTLLQGLFWLQKRIITFSPENYKEDIFRAHMELIISTGKTIEKLIMDTQGTKTVRGENYICNLFTKILNGHPLISQSTFKTESKVFLTQIDPEPDDEAWYLFDNSNALNTSS